MVLLLLLAVHLFRLCQMSAAVLGHLFADVLIEVQPHLQLMQIRGLVILRQCLAVQIDIQLVDGGIKRNSYVLQTSSTHSWKLSA